MLDKTSGIEELSERQKEVLRLVGEYLQAKEIAIRLNIEPSTVRTHLEEARRRVGVGSSRAAAKALLEYEQRQGIRNDDGRQPIRIGDGPYDPSQSGHEQDFSTERTLSDRQLDRAGTGLEDARIPGQAAPDLGRHSGGSDTRSELRTGTRDFQYGRRHRLADRQWALFDRRLEALTLWQWFGMALLITVLLAVAGGVLVQAALSVFKGLSEFSRHSG
ncbi:response regulator transcription factor [Asticcacaulis benevestitus]|uniref:HTH luxR-type domain-containing protein n=1 Tax=Asticcacaulis benevestitus DSM 16100 = ATCC BAA-896 TaxID=1121022 RepID=V4PW51_9CAUL|nr:helix-turn-helix transcriptional regulator [Asticcacaulis benevestitus]ESQ92576.1 hypothetical protein ABENE_08025 [Asticcacaulis benevestitus DSM 16100 = ATCC BAA-896]